MQKAEYRGKYDFQHIPGYFLATSLTELRLLVQYDTSSNLLAKYLTWISEAPPRGYGEQGK